MFPVVPLAHLFCCSDLSRGFPTAQVKGPFTYGTKEDRNEGWRMGTGDWGAAG